MIYVGKNQYKLGRLKLSHMAADSLTELHAMAKQLGLPRRHFQAKPGRPHYDICQANKRQALKLGAKLVSDKYIIKILNQNFSY